MSKIQCRACTGWREAVYLEVEKGAVENTLIGVSRKVNFYMACLISSSLPLFHLMYGRYGLHRLPKLERS